MKQVLNMSRFTKLVNEFVKEMNKKHPDVYKETGSRYYPSALKIIEDYGAKYNVGFNEAQDVCNDTTNKGYLEFVPKAKSATDVDILMMTTQGRKFVGKPFGFIEEVLGEYSRSFALITGGTIVAIIYGLVRVLKWL